MHTRSRERQAAEALVQLSHAVQSPVVLATLVQEPSHPVVLATLVQAESHANRVQGPSGPAQSPSILNRALSHHYTALARARTLFPSTQPGDTILMNFFVDAAGYATVQYMKNEDGAAHIHRMEAPFADIHNQWTYEVTDFPFR